MDAHIVHTGEFDRNIAELARQAADAAEARNRGVRYGPTISVARIVAALKAIGLERSDFRCRNECNSKGEYKGAIASLHHRGAHEYVARFARELAAGAEVRVLIVPMSVGPHCIVSTLGEPGVEWLDRTDNRHQEEDR